MPFAESFRNFVDTGFFELTNSELTFAQLDQINNYLQENAIDSLQFHLTNITLNVTTQEVPEPPKIYERIEQGAVTSREAPNRYLSAREMDRVNFYGVYSSHGKFISMGSGATEEALQHHQQHDPRRIIEKKFSRFFTINAWDSIKLNKLTISYKKGNFLFSSNFVSNLLSDLGEHQKQLTELNIKNIESNPYDWINFLRKKPQLKILSFEINVSVDKYLKELGLVLAKDSQLITLDLGDTTISVKGYQYLNELLDKNYRIETMLLKEPIDRRSREIFNKINERLPAGRTGKERFDIEKFNQAEFLRFILSTHFCQIYQEGKNKDVTYGIQFLLMEKRSLAINYQVESTLLEVARLVGDVYSDHKEYLDGRWPLFKLDLNKSVDDGTRTVGHLLLEHFLNPDDHEMMQCLLEGGANLFEQRQGTEKPFLVQAFESNGENCKTSILQHLLLNPEILNRAIATAGHLLLDHSLQRDNAYLMQGLLRAGANLFEQREGAEKPFLVRAFETTGDCKAIILEYILFNPKIQTIAKEVLDAYQSFGKLSNMELSVRKYGDILQRRADPSKLSRYEKLLNVLKNLAGLSRPSEKRDAEFAEIYGHLVQALLSLHDALGQVTEESVSNVQTILTKIIFISKNAARGLKNTSRLHQGAIRLAELQYKDLENENSKELIEKDNALYAQKRVIDQQGDTIKGLIEGRERDRVEYSENFAKITAENAKLKAELADIKATLRLLRGSNPAEASRASTSQNQERPGTSKGFFPRP